MPDDHLSQLGRSCHLRYAAPEETLMEAGDSLRRVFFIVRGRVRVVVDDEDGEEIVLNVCGAGETLGEMSAIDGQGHSARVVTITACELLWMSHEDFERCLETMPRLSLNVARLLAGRVRKATLQVQSLSTQNTTLRLIHNLLWLDEIEAIKSENDFLPVTQTELAGMCSCSRSQLHRVLNDVVKAGLVERGRKGLRVLDRDALQLWGRAKKNEAATKRR